MGRAALGAAAKTKTGSVRVTETEDGYFKARYGTLGKFLQLKVNEELAKVRAVEDKTHDRCEPTLSYHTTPHRGCILR